MTYNDLVTMVRGSPSGTTEAMLISHGAKAAQLRRLEEEGHARTEVQELERPKMFVRWYFPCE